MIDSGPLFDDGELRLPDGTIVAGAQVLDEMARGGMGIVYRARLEGENVALKVGKAAAQGHQAEARFSNEWKLGKSLKHPNIVRPLKFGRLKAPKGFEGRMFLMTELVEALPLVDLMMNNAEGVPMGRLLRIARQIASALVALHERGIVHRDIKPGNILVGEDDGVHLIDFGFAYALGDNVHQKRTDDLTLEGEAPGTRLYMSPQQAMHAGPSRSFDIYSFGVVLYEMCCGAAPHAHLPRQQVAAARLDPNEKPMSLSMLAPGTPAELVTMIERCLAIEPDDRPSASELLEFFEEGAPEERSTLPELRVVGASAEEPVGEEPVGEEPVGDEGVAADARQADDESTAELRQDDVVLPSVVVEGHLRQPKRMAVVAVATTEIAEPEPEPEPEENGGEKRKPWWIVLVLVLLVFVGAAAFVWGRADEALSEAPSRDPAVYEPDLAGLADSHLDLRRDLGGGAPAAEAEAEPEPEPEPEPKPSVEIMAPSRQPKGRHKGKKQHPVKPAPKVEPVPKADGEEADTDACKARRTAAQRAHDRGAPRSVLENTRDRSCWKGHAEDRRYLRASAFFDQRDYDACARAAQGGELADTRALARICTSKMKDPS